MKILEPVNQSEIPMATGGTDAKKKYADLYERVLSLNGKALPVEFEDTAGAMRQCHSWRQPSSGCFKHGIRVRQRGNIVYLTKDSA